MHGTSSAQLFEAPAEWWLKPDPNVVYACDRTSPLAHVPAYDYEPLRGPSADSRICCELPEIRPHSAIRKFVDSWRIWDLILA
ncbi:hypothetical protein V499_05077 [Pseudogymnoascus sp. VKM F-103]|nr:hypothetical protein V499_05077 [Pseudogymnoascus sp. VKM F-103]